MGLLCGLFSRICGFTLYLCGCGGDVVYGLFVLLVFMVYLLCLHLRWVLELWVVVLFWWVRILT